MPSTCTAANVGGSPLDNNAHEVHRRLGAVEQPGEGGAVVEGAGYELSSLGGEETGAGDVPDQRAHAMAALQEQRGKMASDKPGGTGDGD